MKTISLICLVFISGCGQSGQSINEPDQAPMTPDGCAFVRTDSGATISTAKNLYVYSCAPNAIYLDKFGLIEKMCSDTPSHACP